MRSASLAALLVLTAPAAAQPDAHFEKAVRPVLVEKCVSCHGPDKQKGGLRVDSRAALLAGGDRGPALVPGDPGKSLLLHALAHDGELRMPPKDKLPAPAVAAVAAWVKAGAPWPDSAPAAAAPKATGPRPITAEERAFWAFQPVRRPQVPGDRNQETRNPIDAFLLAKLREQGLGFAPPADPRLLLRRVTFDLTGLPPTPAETDAFLRDSALRNPQSAFDTVVDRLLASPAYGEKWGRRWLDVARYADSNGMDENLAYVNAWRYRDWVIRSLNADKPYDRFVREQVAGDLLAGGTDAERADRLTATGFLVVGPKMLAEDDPMKMRMDIVDEQLDTLGQAFLGLTLGCARCHDHKFDPIRAEDYYALAGMFASTKTMKNHNVVAAWNERPLGNAASAAALAAHEKTVAAAKAEVKAADAKVKAAVTARLTEERKRAADYTAAAAEVARRAGPLKLIADLTKDAPAGTIRVEAEAFARGNVLKLTDGYGAGIGVVINAGPLPNAAEYDIDLPAAGTYQLAVRYAAAESRPVRVSVGDRLLTGAACGAKTGSWNPDAQAWHAEAVVALPAGKAVVKFERAGPFPHLDKFALVPLTPEQAAAAPRSVEEVAADRKLLASVLRQSVEGAAARKDDPFRTSATVEAEVAPDAKREATRLREALAAVEKARPPVDEAMAVEDAKGANLRVHLRGNHLTLGAEVPRRVPQVFADAAPPIGADRSGRLELADWITRPTNPLTARVMVNRLWAGYFGVGLVRTPDNFGRLGERPSHPELLDWLAAEFVEKGWSLKHMHRLMVTSAAYQQSSEIRNADFGMRNEDRLRTTAAVTGFPALIPHSAFRNPQSADPENRLLSRFPRRRLDAEEVRDGMLAVSGLLDRTAGGTLLKATPRQYVTSTASRSYDLYDQPRRTVYLPIIRSAVYDVLQTLDFPDPSVPAGQRPSTVVPTQALFMLNGALVDRAAEALAGALLAAPGDDAARVAEAYRRTFGRAPTTAELDRVATYLTRSEAAADGAPAERRLRAWRGLCRVLLASNEFVFVE